MRLVLDLSPTLVNQTAVRNIGHAVAEALSSASPSLQYFGDRFEAPLPSTEAARLRARLGEMLASGPPAAGNPACAPARERVFFLDPLYVLFSKVTAADVVLVHDLSTLTHPAWHGAGVGPLYRAAFTRILQSGAQLVAVSQNTADTLCANFGYPRAPVRVLPLFVPPYVADGAEPRAPPRPYLLFVGSLERRKNLAGLIAAYRLSELNEAGCDLLIVGGAGHGDHLALEAAKATEGVRLHGFVPDAALAGLYRGAAGFAYPSYLEGFGVPLLEALHHGLPAVASTTGASPEVAGELAAYSDPDDHASLADEMIQMFRMTPEARSAHAARAKAWVESRFSLQAFQQRVRALLLPPLALRTGEDEAWPRELGRCAQ